MNPMHAIRAHIYIRDNRPMKLDDWAGIIRCGISIMGQILIPRKERRTSIAYSYASGDKRLHRKYEVHLHS